MRTLRTGPVFLLLVVALAALGVGYAAWADAIRIDGSVETGAVSVEFGRVFTNDDDTFDEAGFDDGDTGNCERPPAAVGSCDPQGGGDPAPRGSTDVGRCASFVAEPGVVVTVVQRAYPGYTCAAFVEARNDGSVPVRLGAIVVNDHEVLAGVTVDIDLDGDAHDDLRLAMTGADDCEQMEPGEALLLRVGHEFLAPNLDSELGYHIEFRFQQWNRNCGV